MSCCHPLRVVLGLPEGLLLQVPGAVEVQCAVEHLALRRRGEVVEVGSVGAGVFPHVLPDQEVVRVRHVVEERDVVEVIDDERPHGLPAAVFVVQRPGVLERHDDVSEVAVGVGVLHQALQLHLQVQVLVHHVVEGASQHLEASRLVERVQRCGTAVAVQDDPAFAVDLYHGHVHDGVPRVIRHLLVTRGDVVYAAAERHHLVQRVVGDVPDQVLRLVEGVRLVLPQVIVGQEAPHPLVHHVDVGVHHLLPRAVVEVLYLIAGAVPALLGAGEDLLEIEMVRSEIHHQSVVPYLVGTHGPSVVTAVADGVHEVVGHVFLTVGESQPGDVRDDALDLVARLGVPALGVIGVEDHLSHVGLARQPHLLVPWRDVDVGADDDHLLVPVRVTVLEERVEVFLVGFRLFGLFLGSPALCHLVERRVGERRFRQVPPADRHRLLLGDHPGYSHRVGPRLVDRVSRLVLLGDVQLSAGLVVAADVYEVAVPGM